MNYDDKIFTEIKNVFLNKFNDCCILYHKTTLKIGFDRREDAHWFEKNIIRGKKGSVISKASLNPLKRIITDYKFEYSFEVKDKDKLIKLLNER